MVSVDPFRRYNVSTFYHFTDRRNLPLIRELGGLYSLAKLREMEVEIPAPGGNQWSHDADADRGLDRYVHLCFMPNHPMEYIARAKGRIASSIFLQVRPEVINREGVLFTAGVSNKAGSTLHTIEEARQIIDFEVLYTHTDWRDAVIQQRRQQAEKYEILVPDHIPLELIRKFPNG